MNETYDEMALRIADELGSIGTGREFKLEFARRLKAEIEKGAEPWAYGVESSHSGDVVVRETFDDEETAKVHCAMNGGIVVALYAKPPADTQDAKRYRWLKDHAMWISCADDDTEKGNFVLGEDVGSIFSLDAAIDAAMERKKMKLPKHLCTERGFKDYTKFFGPGDIEAIVRDCAIECLRHGDRTEDCSGLTTGCHNAILARYGLEPK